MYPVCHQGSAQDTCILMYLMCIPKCILDSFGIRVKYMHNVKDTCILLECNRACKIHLRYIRIHKGYMYPSEYMQDTCKIHKDTSGYVSDRKPPPKRIGNPPAPGSGRRQGRVRRPRRLQAAASSDVLSRPRGAVRSASGGWRGFAWLLNRPRTFGIRLDKLIFGRRAARG